MGVFRFINIGKRYGTDVMGVYGLCCLRKFTPPPGALDPPGNMSRVYGRKNEYWDRGTAHSSQFKHEPKTHFLFVLEVRRMIYFHTQQSTIPLAKTRS